MLDVSSSSYVQVLDAIECGCTADSDGGVSQHAARLTQYRAAWQQDVLKHKRATNTCW